jgi:hypothetical protein
MHMRRRILGLLVLLTMGAVAPASAGQFVDGSATRDFGCPYERARLEAAGYQTITVTEGEAGAILLFDPSRRSAFLAP